MLEYHCLFPCSPTLLHLSKQGNLLCRIFSILFSSNYSASYSCVYSFSLQRTVGVLPPWTAVNNAARNICAQVFLRDCIFIAFHSHPGIQWVGCMLILTHTRFPQRKSCMLSMHFQCSKVTTHSFPWNDFRSCKGHLNLPWGENMFSTQNLPPAWSVIMQ